MQSVLEFLINAINQTKMALAGKFDLQTAKLALLSQHTAVNVMSTIMPEKLNFFLSNAWTGTTTEAAEKPLRGLFFFPAAIEAAETFYFKCAVLPADYKSIRG